VDCLLGSWTKWSECSSSCGGGVELRTRQILVVAAHGGVACNTSDLLQSTACEEVSCPIHCVWGHWSEWSTCTKECEGGVTYRHRSEVIVAEYGGKQCEGSADEDRGLKFLVRYPSLNFVVRDIYITHTYHIISYRIVSYRIVSYRIISYRIVSYHIISHTHTHTYIYTYLYLYIYFSPQSIQWSIPPQVIIQLLGFSRRWFAMPTAVRWTANLAIGPSGATAQRAVTPGTGATADV